MAKYAVLVNSGIDDVGPTANALEYALDLDEGGHEADVYFDGESTQWIGELADNPDHPVNDYFTQARERDLVAGVCGYCADAFGAYEDALEAGVEAIGGEDSHGPSVSALVDDGYELLTVG